MIRHIVLWKFKDVAEGNEKEENMKKAKEILSALPPLILQIKAMTVGADVLKTDSSFDFALAVDFETVGDLNDYIVHPEHKKVGVFIRAVVEQRVSADIEF